MKSEECNATLCTDKVKEFAATVLGLFALCLMLTGCSKPSAEQQAAEAALSYYNRLLEGYPDGVLAAHADYDRLPADYREQLKKSYQQLVADIDRRHGGLQAVSISPNVGRRDSLPSPDGRWQHIVYAFLQLTFRDSTQEEITVPMIQCDGDWRIR